MKHTPVSNAQLLFEHFCLCANYDRDADGIYTDKVTAMAFGVYTVVTESALRDIAASRIAVRIKQKYIDKLEADVEFWKRKATAKTEESIGASHDQ